MRLCVGPLIHHGFKIRRNCIRRTRLCSAASQNAQAGRQARPCRARPAACMRACMHACMRPCAPRLEPRVLLHHDVHALRQPAHAQVLGGAVLAVRLRRHHVLKLAPHELLHVAPAVGRGGVRVGWQWWGTVVAGVAVEGERVAGRRLCACLAVRWRGVAVWGMLVRCRCTPLSARWLALGTPSTPSTEPSTPGRRGHAWPRLAFARYEFGLGANAGPPAPKHSHSACVPRVLRAHLYSVSLMAGGLGCSSRASTRSAVSFSIMPCTVRASSWPRSDAHIWISSCAWRGGKGGPGERAGRAGDG